MLEKLLKQLSEAELTLPSDKGIIFHGFSQTYFVEFHSIATFKLHYTFIKLQLFRYFGILCAYRNFWSPFQPELSFDSLYSYIDCYISNYSHLYIAAILKGKANLESYRGHW